MTTFFTSDLHLGHDNIRKYCNRPFKSEDQMNNAIIHNWNQRVKPEDTVIHLGDFCFKGGWQGGKVKARYWQSQLNGNIVFAQGNHDSNNSVKSVITHVLMEFGNLVVLGCHIPPQMRLEVPEFCDLVLCGHVHEKWKYKWLEGSTELGNDTIPMINVGVDVWNFMPVRLDEIIVYYDKIIKGRK